MNGSKGRGSVDAPRTGEGHEGRTRFRGLMSSYAAAACILAAVIVSTPLAQGASPNEELAVAQTTPPGLGLTPELLQKSAEAPTLSNQTSDPVAARELPHHDLDRAEAVELTTQVFAPLLEEVDGVFSGLEVSKYLSDNSAVVFAESQEDGVGAAGNAQTPADEPSVGRQKVLLESSLPLRQENALGVKVPVDLGLKRNGASLEPESPLVEVSIPGELKEGVELPELGISLEMVGVSSDRVPTITGENLVTYPNVASDMDFSVVPTPTGVETLTTLRTAAAPTTQTFRMNLAPGETLREEGEGAVVEDAGQPVLAVDAPESHDASGNAVPTHVSTLGDTFTVSVDPGPQVSYPILVDPLLESYDWYDNYATPDANTPWYFSSSSPLLTGRVDSAGLWVEAAPGNYPAYVSAGWTYFVPRLKEEEAAGRTPTSFIQRMDLMHIGFGTTSGPYSPYFTAGIMGAGHWAGKPGSEAVFGYGGNAAPIYAWQGNSAVPGLTLHFENGTAGNRDQTAKSAIGLAFGTAEAASLASRRSLILGWGSVEVADEDAPKLANGSISPWMNQVATSPISADATDSGLGVKYVGYSLPGGQGWRTAANPCTGTAKNPCPRTWHTWVEPNQYNPATMPQGVDQVPLAAEDILGNHLASETVALLRIDHTKPVVGLGGSVLEQASLGTTLPSYTLKINASDGTETEPQSGVVSMEVKVDGTLVEPKYNPGCATKNCAISREVTLTSSTFTPGTHNVEVVATDGVGLVGKASATFTISKDTTSPTVTASGSFFEGPMGWLKQKSYPANVVAKDPKGYGLRSLTLSVDGKVVKSTSLTCPAGSCESSISTTMNLASYAGGEHEVKVVAQDGAGNTTTRTWPIYVDPTGPVSDSEAVHTVEALEKTNEETGPLSGPTAEENRMSEGHAVGVELKAGEVLVSKGTQAESSVAVSNGEATIETPQGPIAVSPVIPPVGSSSQVVEGIAGVSSDVKSNTDAVIRPKYNGVLQFQDIRDPSAPETFAWEIDLVPGEVLQAIPGGVQAGVYFEGIEMMLIEAMPAHDALGHNVPTSLAVTASDVVTLTVAHRTGTYVYPVMAGPSFEVGWSTVEAILPPPPGSIGLNAIESEFEGYESVSAPVPTPAGAAAASGIYKEEHFNKVLCSHQLKFAEYGLSRNTGDTGNYEERCGDPWKNKPGVFLAFREGLHGRFFQRSPNSRLYAEVHHEGSPTESIGCVAEATPGGKPEELRRARKEVCVWWGKTTYGGGASATWGFHITPVSFNIGEYRGWCGDECGGTPNPWQSFEMPPMVFYLWADGHYVYHSTRCIDC